MNKLVLTYQSLEDLNIGDYVQSIAALQFLGKKTVKYWDREKLTQYDGKPAKLIMNCWFSSKYGNFPPSSRIKPLFISFHLNAKDADAFLEDHRNIEYLSQFKAVGCRDISTASRLKSKGVNAYFSGCLTLTLGNTYKPCNANNKICFVDAISTRSTNRNLREKVAELVSDLIFFARNTKEVLKVRESLYQHNHLVNRTIGISWRRVQYSIQTFKVVKNLISPKLWASIVYYTHHYNAKAYDSDAERFERADFLLKEYASSCLVISSRIHAILPSTGIGVPALYLNQKNDDPLSECRKSGLTDLLNHVDLIGSKIVRNEHGLIETTNQIKPLNKHQGLVEKLSEDVIEYLEESL